MTSLTTISSGLDMLFSIFEMIDDDGNTCEPGYGLIAVVITFALRLTPPAVLLIRVKRIKLMLNTNSADN